MQARGYRAAWAAGFLDGEGCFTSRLPHGASKSIVPLIVVTQCAVEPLEVLCELFSGNIYDKKKSMGGVSQTWQWVLTNARQIESALMELIPHLVLKKAQAVKLLDLCDLVPAAGERLVPGQFEAQQAHARQLKEMKRAA